VPEWFVMATSSHKAKGVGRPHGMSHTVKRRRQIYDVGKLRWVVTRNVTIDFNGLNRRPRGYDNLSQSSG